MDSIETMSNIPRVDTIQNQLHGGSLQGVKSSPIL